MINYEDFKRLYEKADKNQHVFDRPPEYGGQELITTERDFWEAAFNMLLSAAQFEAKRANAHRGIPQEIIKSFGE